MDHTAVVRQRMTERYLLDELDSEVQEEFEEHYFDCPECALDICVGAQFVSDSKTVLGENRDPVSDRETHRRVEIPAAADGLLGSDRHLPRLRWLFKLAVVGYQNLVYISTSRLQPGPRSASGVCHSASVNCRDVGEWWTGYDGPRRKGPASVCANPAGQRFCALYRRFVRSPWTAERFLCNRPFSRAGSVVGNGPRDRSGSRHLYDGRPRCHHWRGKQRARQRILRVTNSEVSSERSRGTLLRL